jgi:hypothetical protein
MKETATDPAAIIEIDCEARELTDRGGPRPTLDWRYAALFAAVAAFLLVRGIDAIGLSDLALWPVMILTALCSAGAGSVQRWREQSWRARYTQARVEIMARVRSTPG